MRLTTFMLLSLTIAVTEATPLKRRSGTVQPKKSYPPAGYRPHIPFELPNERKITELTDAMAYGATPKSSRDPNVDVEVIIENTDTTSIVGEENVVDSKDVLKLRPTNETTKTYEDTKTEEQVEVNKNNSGIKVEMHIPAAEYGPPEISGEEKVEEPANNFQPPTKEAEEFVTPISATDDGYYIANSNNFTSDADVDIIDHPNANFPSQDGYSITKDEMDGGNVDAGSIKVNNTLNAEKAKQPEPATEYGPPKSEVNKHLPAENYCPPDRTVMPPEIEEEEFGVELNELEPMSIKEEDKVKY